MVMTPEFHTFGSPLPMGPRTSPPPEVASDPRSYKALVMVFMNGGAGLCKRGRESGVSFLASSKSDTASLSFSGPLGGWL